MVVETGYPSQWSARGEARVGRATPPKFKKRCRSSYPSGSVHSFYNRCEVEKAGVASGSAARAPTRGSDEDGGPGCSAANGRSDNQSDGYIQGRRGQQTGHDRGQGPAPGHSRRLITLTILGQLLRLHLIPFRPLEIAVFIRAISQAHLAIAKADAQLLALQRAKDAGRSDREKALPDAWWRTSIWRGPRSNLSSPVCNRIDMGNRLLFSREVSQP